jgi:hypothetical protein
MVSEIWAERVLGDSAAKETHIRDLDDRVQIFRTQPEIT